MSRTGAHGGADVRPVWSHVSDVDVVRRLLSVWSSVGSRKILSQPSPVMQLMWPAADPSTHTPATLVSSLFLMSSFSLDHDGEDSQTMPSGVSDRKVLKIIQVNSDNFNSNIFVYNLKQCELLPRHIMGRKTTSLSFNLRQCPQKNNIHVGDLFVQVPMIAMMILKNQPRRTEGSLREVTIQSGEANHHTIHLYSAQAAPPAAYVMLLPLSTQ